MKREVLERIQTVPATIKTAITDIFASPVPSDKIRYVFSIHLFGDGINQQKVDILKKEIDGSYTPKFTGVNLAATGNFDLGKGDPERPIIVLEGGTNLAGKSSVANITATILYWDDEK